MVLRVLWLCNCGVRVYCGCVIMVLRVLWLCNCGVRVYCGCIEVGRHGSPVFAVGQRGSHVGPPHQVPEESLALQSGSRQQCQVTTEEEVRGFFEYLLSTQPPPIQTDNYVNKLLRCEYADLKLFKLVEFCKIP